MEKCRNNLQSQFDQWYNNVTSREEVFYGDDGGDKHTSAYVGGGATKASVGPSGKGRSTGGITTTTTATNNNGNSNSNSNSSSSSNNNSSYAVGSSGNNANYATTEVNEDIQAFYSAKDQLLKRREQEELKRKAADR